MRTTVRIFYTLFFLAFVSQLCYGGSGNFLYSGVNNTVAASVNTASSKPGSSIVCSVSKTHRQSNPQTAIRVKALNQHCFIAVSPFVIFSFCVFPVNAVCFSISRPYTSSGTEGAHLLRGPPAHIA